MICLFAFLWVETVNISSNVVSINITFRFSCAILFYRLSVNFNFWVFFCFFCFYNYLWLSPLCQLHSLMHSLCFSFQDKTQLFYLPSLYSLLFQTFQLHLFCVQLLNVICMAKNDCSSNQHVRNTYF